MPVPAVLGVSVICAGAAYPVTGAALGLTSPAVISVCRALVGGLVMLPLLRMVGARLPSTWVGWGWALVIGFGNVTVTLAGIAEGTRLAGAAVASVLLNSAPFFAAVLARVFLGEGLTRLRVIGLITGFAGILVIVASQPSSGGSHVAEGAVVCLLGALGWAGAGLGMRYLSVRDAGFDVWGASTAQFFCGGVLLIPYLAATGGFGGTDWSSAKLWASLVFLVLGAQIVTYVGFYLALAQWSSARVFSWTFLVPVAARKPVRCRGHGRPRGRDRWRRAALPPASRRDAGLADSAEELMIQGRRERRAKRDRLSANDQLEREEWTAFVSVGNRIVGLTAIPTRNRRVIRRQPGCSKRRPPRGGRPLRCRRGRCTPPSGSRPGPPPRPCPSGRSSTSCPVRRA